PGANLLTVGRGGAAETHFFRIFEIAHATITVNISGITIFNGHTEFDTPGGGVGGGILNMMAATLNLKDVTVNGNQTGAGGHSSGGSGGGIFNEGTLTIVNSTISDNQTGKDGDGGGIYNGSTLTLINSTISGNQTGPGGGGGGGVRNY